MKNFTEYIYNINEDLILENENGEIIVEGFWKKLGRIMGFIPNKIAAKMHKWTDDLQTGFTAGQIAAAKGKNEKDKEAAKEEAEAAEESKDKLLEVTKNQVEKLIKRLDGIENSDFVMAQYQQLRSLSKELDDKEGAELAEKFKKLIDKKFPDGGKNYEKLEEKVKKSGVDKGPDENGDDEKDNKDDEGDEEKPQELGVTDEGEPQKISAEQEEKQVTKDIKDNKEFFAPLAQAVGLDGESLRTMIVNMINESFKEKAGEDKDGNAIYKWKKDISKNTLAAWAAQKDHEKNLIEGMAAMLCGAMLISHKTLTEGVTSLLIDHGFKKKDYISALKK